MLTAVGALQKLCMALTKVPQALPCAPHTLPFAPQARIICLGALAPLKAEIYFSSSTAGSHPAWLALLQAKKISLL